MKVLQPGDEESNASSVALLLFDHNGCSSSLGDASPAQTQGVTPKSPESGDVRSNLPESREAVEDPGGQSPSRSVEEVHTAGNPTTVPYAVK